MDKTKEAIVVISPAMKRAFAGVRGRVKAAVAAQPPSVSFSEALAQVQKFQVSGGTKK